MIKQHRQRMKEKHGERLNGGHQSGGAGSWSRDVTIDLFGLLDNICYKHFLQSVKKNAQRYKTCIKLIPRISG